MSGYLTSFVVFSLLVTQGVSHPRRVPHIREDLAHEEYGVYDAVVGKLFAGKKVAFDSQAPVDMLVIKDRTVMDHRGYAFDDSNIRWQSILKQLSPISEDTVASLKERNKSPHPLYHSFNLPISYMLVEAKEVEQVWKERRWKEFYEKYPASGGFISFSRVGFNREMNEALVYFEHWCGRVCGSGFYLVLKKDEVGWKVAKMDRAWIS